MTRPHLRACSSCARHVRVSEEACPFCGSALADSFRAAPAPQAPGARLTRAALFAFGAGTLALTPACSSSTSSTATTDAGQSDGQTQESLDSGLQPAYGGPGLGEDGGGLQPVYGAPADSGVIGVIDSGAEPAYGGAPFDSGH
jgi:hypothetical protein